MKIQILIAGTILIILLLSGCDTIQTTQLSPEEQKFIGTWENINTDYYGTATTILKFNPNMTVCINRSFIEANESAIPDSVDFPEIYNFSNFTQDGIIRVEFSPVTFWNWKLDDGKLSIGSVGTMETWNKNDYTFTTPTELIIGGVVYTKVN